MMNSGSKKHRSNRKHDSEDKKHSHDHHHHHHHHHHDDQRKDVSRKTEPQHAAELTARISPKISPPLSGAQILPRAPAMKVDLPCVVSHRHESPTSPASRSGLSAASTPVLTAKPNPVHPVAATVGSPPPRGAVVGRWLLDGGTHSLPLIGPHLPEPAVAPLIGPRLPEPAVIGPQLS
jgi:hypothetical protein